MSTKFTCSSTTQPGILFTVEPHPDEDHCELHAVLNEKYRRNLAMTIKEMKENDCIYTTDRNGEDHFNDNIVANLK